jgi:chemotaxis response regulator CheB
MKAKLVQFYQEKVQPRIEALTAKAVQLKQRLTAWLARHKCRLGIVAAVLVTLAVVALTASLWRRSPAFRAAAKNLAVAVAGGLAALGAILTRKPAEIPVPVVVTEQPPVEEAFPVGGADGRLS